MPKEMVYFMGFLANVDSSILQIQAALDYGFRVAEKSSDRAEDDICAIEGVPRPTAVEKLVRLQCLSPYPDKLHFFSNSLEAEIKKTKDGILKSIPFRFIKFHSQSVKHYLFSLVRLMRLFGEGNIRIPLIYWYYYHEGHPRAFYSGGTGLFVAPEPYFLPSSEVPALLIFVKKTKIPLAHSFVQLAFENFELSYETPNTNLSFLSLMMGLETLLNRGRQNIRSTLARNAAVLLGKDRNEAEAIFSGVKGLYDKRSAIIHTGKSDVMGQGDLKQLRRYVREAIKEAHNVGKDKDDLVDLLNSCELGQRPWRE